MKEVNLISFIDAFKDLDPIDFQEYLKFYQIRIKNDELNGLDNFIDILKKNIKLQKIRNSFSLFDKYFIGYSIPHIGKEFDLLRIGEDSVINIELKSENTDYKICEQLKSNKYYLSFLNKSLFCYTYVVDEKKLYFLNESDILQEVDFSELINNLSNQNVKKIENIDSLFNPSNYLVSPFNSTQKFIEEKYFLTQHQREIETKIFKYLNQTTEYSIISIEGGAGTGKTLLVYHIARKKYEEGKKVLIIHCGQLNNGHTQLIREKKWDIISVKDIKGRNLSEYNLIIVDEAQRIYTNHLGILINEVKKTFNNIIFSYDPEQTLHKSEKQNEIPKQIEKELTIDKFKLKKGIRINEEILLFIKYLFKKGTIKPYNYNNIEISYFSDYSTALFYVYQMQSENWKAINYTPSTIKSYFYQNYKIIREDDNPHTVIGQEFDNVIAIIDEHFYYDENNDLEYLNCYYDVSKMLFQIMSRTKYKLSLVIVKNKDIFKRCLQILTP